MVSGFYETITSPHIWPKVLRTVADQCGAAGASCRLRNRVTGEIWFRVSSGYPDGTEERYANYYAKLDLYTPLVAEQPLGRWSHLAQTVPLYQLSRSEWYQDYVRSLDTVDIFGVRLAEFGPNSLIFSVAQGIGGSPIQAERLCQLEDDLKALTHATRLRFEFGQLRCSSAAATIAAGQLGAAIMLCDQRGRILEANPKAEELLRAGDGLYGQNGYLSARRHFEAARLQQLIAVAAQSGTESASGGRMLIARSTDAGPLIVSVSPLTGSQTYLGQPAALVLVRCTNNEAPPEEDLVELFGLSRAEARLAAKLAEGDRLSSIAVEFGVKVSTLRTQLGSILKKLNVDRQSELARLLASIPRPAR